jgi:dTDP-4-dehydrorhamnose 3,5-epimerase
MKVSRLAIPDLAVVEPQAYGDSRGEFFESWNRTRFAEHGIAFDVVQANVSRSVRGVLRGLHYQWPNPQGKLVSVLDGEVWDVAVDIRRGSPTFGRWEAVVLTADNRRQFWIPEGFAHGFVVTSERATFSYLCTAPYDRAADAALRWDDPALAIDWPLAVPTLSDKDARAPLLADVPPERLPEYAA